MVDSSEAHNHPVDQNDDARLNLTGIKLQDMIDTAVNKAVDRVLKDHKRKCDNTPNKGYKKGKASSNQSKPNEARPKCKTCKKKHFGNVSMNRPGDVASVKKGITRLMNART